MRPDEPPPAEQPGDRRLSHPEIEAQIRDANGPKLEGCERLHAFGEDALYTWAGRAIHPGSVDPILVAEGARATKTFGGALRLVARGFGPQASMLNRSLFEGMASHTGRTPTPSARSSSSRSTAGIASCCGATSSRRRHQPTRA